MPRYYFHLRDGEDVLLDPEGRELSSLQAVHADALLEARSIISHEAIEGLVKLSYHLDVENASGAVVHRLNFEDAVEVIRGVANDSL